MWAITLVSVCSAATLTQMVCSDFSCSQTACNQVRAFGGCVWDKTSTCTGTFSLDCQSLAERLVYQQYGTDAASACELGVPFYGTGCTPDSSNASYSQCKGTYTPYTDCSQVPLQFCNSSVELMSGDRCYSDGIACLNATSCSVLPSNSDCVDYIIGWTQCNTTSGGCVDGWVQTCGMWPNDIACEIRCASVYPFGQHCRWDRVGEVCGYSEAPSLMPTPQPVRPPTPNEFVSSGSSLTDRGLLVELVVGGLLLLLLHGD